MHTWCTSEQPGTARIWIIHKLNNEPANNQELTAAFRNGIQVALVNLPSPIRRMHSSPFPWSQETEINSSHSQLSGTSVCEILTDRQTDIFLLVRSFWNFPVIYWKAVQAPSAFLKSKPFFLPLAPRIHFPDSSCCLIIHTTNNILPYGHSAFCFTKCINEHYLFWTPTVTQGGPTMWSPKHILWVSWRKWI